VKLDYTRSGRPTDNGLIEFFNGRLRDEFLNAKEFITMQDLRDRLKDWQDDYNDHRPHGSLGHLTPSESVKRRSGQQERAANLWYGNVWLPGERHVTYWHLSDVSGLPGEPPSARPFDVTEPNASLEKLLSQVRACRACASQLPLGPRPVLRAAASARLLIVGQAPGLRVHQSGIPWGDRSGDRLRDWLAIDRAAFYDEARIAIIPMGLCYPGRGAGGDAPPRPECAPLWHGRLLALLPRIELQLLVGQYAQRCYLGARRRASLSETVAAWREYLPQHLPLPHPSPRNQPWLKRHPWFERELLPQLQARVRALLAG
jgi:uracil-DNA glycosylase